MGNVVLLATEASAEGGFGLNFDLLETNLINLAIIIGLLIYYGRGFLGNLLNERQTQIETAIRDAEDRQQKAAAALAEQQQKLAQAQVEAEQIRANAEQRAQALKAQIAEQAVVDLERMKTMANQELDAEQQRVIAQLRAQVAAMALERAEAQIREQLDHRTQEQLVDRSLTMLGGN